MTFFSRVNFSIPFRLFIVNLMGLFVIYLSNNFTFVKCTIPAPRLPALNGCFLITKK